MRRVHPSSASATVPPTSPATGEGDHAKHGGGGEYKRHDLHSPPPPPSAVPLPRFAGEEPSTSRRLRTAAVMFVIALLAACSGSSDDGTFQGYVEGDFVDVAPEVGGRIVELAVRRGGTVAAGDLLFRIDATEAEGAVDQAEAEKARAEAQLANLLGGKRPLEIAVIEAQIAEAQASLDKAQRDFERQQTLFDQKVISQARLDQAREAISDGGGACERGRAAEGCRRHAGTHARDRRRRTRRRRGSRGARAGADAPA